MGVAFKTKDEDTRSEGIACGISACVAGVTEPAMYGINLRFMKPMIGAVVAAGISGLFCGFTGVRGYVAGGSPSFLSLATFIGGEGNPMRGVIFGGIAGAMAFLIAAVISFILYKNPEKAAAAPSGGAASSASVRTGGKVVIASPVPGKVVPLESIPDDTFATGVLGRGIAVEPSEGKVYAPFDGTCVSVFDTKHALNLLSDKEVELLIHMGLETVSLEGKPFTAHVKTGENIQKGQLLLEFDMKKILDGGCKTVTPVIVTNEDDLGSLRIENGQIIVGV